ncbi:MAG TPA: helix-turn-helix transcriptional regulator [Kofleriaceae bacterium]
MTRRTAAQKASPTPKRRAAKVTYFSLAGQEFALIATEVPAALPATLTAAERAVAAEILEGKSNAAIARGRGVAVRTIANQVASILRKLGVGSRAGLVARLTRAAHSSP